MKVDDVVVHWEVSDGYASGGRPQSTRISLEDWQTCENDAEREEMAEDYVREDFENRISYYVKRVDFPEPE